MDRFTVAFNLNLPNGKNNASSAKSAVSLWDTRTRSAVSARFRMSQRMTGLQCLANLGPSSNEHHFLVSSNYSINLFDNRMPRLKIDRPLLSFDHVHEGPELQFAMNKRSLIAAVDRDETVQIYSLRSGHCLGPLERLSRNPASSYRYSKLSNLQWYDDRRDGLCLQACDDKGVVRWSWSGDDEALSP